MQTGNRTRTYVSTEGPQTTGQAVYNRGISGDTSDRLLERLECNALNINPKNLVILFGTNDIGIGVPTEYTLKNKKNQYNIKDYINSFNTKKKIAIYLLSLIHIFAHSHARRLRHQRSCVFFHQLVKAVAFDHIFV